MVPFLTVLALVLGVEPTTDPATGPKAEPKTGPTPVEFQTADGVTIYGWYLHTGDHSSEDGKPHGKEHFADQPAVVLLHMFRSDRYAWQTLVGTFRERGIATLFLDLRGHGESTRGPGGEDLSLQVRDRDPALFNAMWQDAAGAVQWLVDHGHRREHIGLLGASVGCSVAVDAARRDPSLRTVGVLTPGEHYLGVPTLKHLQEWGNRELLLVSSPEEWDQGAGPIQASLQAAGKASVTAWMIPGKKIHGTRMLRAIPNLDDRLAAWFLTRLRGESPADSSSR